MGTVQSPVLGVMSHFLGYLKFGLGPHAFQCPLRDPHRHAALNRQQGAAARGLSAALTGGVRRVKLLDSNRYGVRQSLGGSSGLLGLTRLELV